MKIPELRGLIKRRILANFAAEPEIVARLLPSPLRPKLQKGKAVVGVCLIRLEQIRPSFLPMPIGIASENAAHRMAVCWTDEHGREQEGVYIPRRDSNSLLNNLVGGRLFPGEHHRADFDVKDDGKFIELHARAVDGSFAIDFCGREIDSLPAGSIFADLAEASEFFRRGSVGYSETSDGNRLDGLILSTDSWQVKPLEVDTAFSTFFADTESFPAGSIAIDCALLMRNLDHRWLAAPDMRVRTKECCVD